jgi:hypothetical protein
LAVVSGFAASALAGGPAVNQFEVKSLEAEPGRLEFQSQNAHTFGDPRRKWVEEEPGEFVYDENTLVRQRHALEMELSLTHWLRTRVGIEYESERFDEPESFAAREDFAALALTEVALEAVVILVPVKGQGVGLGMLVEYQKPVREADEAETVFAGPIVEAKYGAWNFIANLMMVKHLGGGERTETGIEDRDEKWDFSYATQLRYRYSERWTLALEAYGTIDRLGDTGTRSEAARVFGDHDQHRAGPVLYYTFKPDWLRNQGAVKSVAAKNDDGTGAEDDEDDEGTSVRIGTGVLFGLNENTPDYALKWSVEIEF